MVVRAGGGCPWLFSGEEQQNVSLFTRADVPRQDDIADVRTGGWFRLGVGFWRAEAWLCQSYQHRATAFPACRYVIPTAPPPTLHACQHLTRLATMRIHTFALGGGTYFSRAFAHCRLVDILRSFTCSILLLKNDAPRLFADGGTPLCWFYRFFCC
jgi:hypothetical protein